MLLLLRRDCLNQRYHQPQKQQQQETHTQIQQQTQPQKYKEQEYHAYQRELEAVSVRDARKTLPVDRGPCTRTSETTRTNCTSIRTQLRGDSDLNRTQKNWSPVIRDRNFSVADGSCQLVTNHDRVIPSEFHVAFRCRAAPQATNE